MTSRIAFVGMLLAACGTAATGPGTMSAPPSSRASASAAAADTTAVAISESTYGRISLRTTAGTHCTIGIHIGPPIVGDLPPTSVEGTADASGALTLSYPAPHLPGGTGRHEVTCATGTAQLDFTIPATISAARFSARIRAPAVSEQIPGTTARLEPALVRPRDLDVEALQRSLAPEWAAATRGLSALDLLTTATADIIITVLPARGTSVHVTEGDGSQAIFLYAADPSSVLTSDNMVAVALHELGHIWCCQGDGTIDGHWAQPVADPLLQGIDRFGVMNHPVNCVLFAAGIESCPNRFSERDLRAMGFTQIPPPPRNACVDSKNTFLGQLTLLKDQLASAKAVITATEAALTTLAAQIKAVEAKYPNGVPPDVYPSYSAMVDRYNAGVTTDQSQVRSYNALLAQSNGIVDQVNKLLC